MIRPRSRAAVACGVIACCFVFIASLPVAHAGGMYLTDRGTRPLGRGFAYVAGADDAQSLWYNPAGLSYAGNQLFLDATLTLMDASYTRVDGGGNALPTVSLDAPPIPIPMIAVTNDFGLDDWTFAAGVLAPNLVPFHWPDEVDVGGVLEPAPQRYSLYSLDGSAAAHVVIGAAWRPTPELSVGLTGHLVVGRLLSEVALSACDRVICTQPESPEWDGRAQIDLPIVTALATVGAIYDTGPVRIGLSFTTPHAMGGAAKLRVRLPEAALFDGAVIEGDEADVSLDMPWILRAGVEVRPDPRVRVEASFVYEGWSIQRSLRVVPKDIWIRDVTAIGDYQVGPIDIPRNMSDVFSARLGGEVAVDDARKVIVRAGGAFESSSFSDEWITPLTLDSSKVVVGLGASVEVTDGFFVDASYGHAFIFDRNVTTSRVPQANPIRPPPVDGAPGTDGPVYVGNGQYDMEANLFGLGVRWQMDPPRPHSSTRGAGGEAEPSAPTEPVVTQVSPETDAETAEAAAPPDDAPDETVSEEALRASPGW